MRRRLSPVVLVGLALCGCYRVARPTWSSAPTSPAPVNVRPTVPQPVVIRAPRPEALLALIEEYRELKADPSVNVVISSTGDAAETMHLAKRKVEQLMDSADRLYYRAWSIRDLQVAAVGAMTSGYYGGVAAGQSVMATMENPFALEEQAQEKLAEAERILFDLVNTCRAIHAGAGLTPKASAESRL